MAAIALTKELYFTTSTVIDWVDIFTRPVYKHIVVESLAYCQEQKGLDIYSWVLMTNHLHMIVGTNKADISLSDILRDFKKYTNKKILAAIEGNQQESRKDWVLDRCHFAGKNDKKIKNDRFWQEGNHVEQLYTYDFYKQKLDYPHESSKAGNRGTTRGISVQLSSQLCRNKRIAQCNSSTMKNCMSNLSDYKSLYSLRSDCKSDRTGVLDHGLNVNANNILIGSNVVSDRQQGPVAVENGKSTIRGKNGVTINNDFEVKLGAAVEITTN